MTTHIQNQMLTTIFESTYNTENSLTHNAFAAWNLRYLQSFEKMMDFLGRNIEIKIFVDFLADNTELLKEVATKLLAPHDRLSQRVNSPEILGECMNRKHFKRDEDLLKKGIVISKFMLDNQDIALSKAEQEAVDGFYHSFREDLQYAQIMSAAIASEAHKLLK
ncbi:hypothetical protein OH460_08140 [Vibrio sp. Makdt]|uniref:hypothetical protein n=1 Tax=Vibrio sp. Makdt TaxID=2998828 RepID=UPI0022CD515D|nr:hypothetical protein [Vibrio sp. Makdt]MDA0152268.1 hypothetical protein [Vibrio sp. Makdt]